MDEAIVATYANRLAATLGDDYDFMAVFRELSADKGVRQAEAVGILCVFLAPAPATTSKKVALERILRRHQSLYTSKLKQRAMGGRSAA